MSGVAPETLNLLVPVINGGRYFYALKGGADYEGIPDMEETETDYELLSDEDIEALFLI